MINVNFIFPFPPYVYTYFHNCLIIAIESYAWYMFNISTQFQHVPSDWFWGTIGQRSHELIIQISEKIIIL